MSADGGQPANESIDHEMDQEMGQEIATCQHMQKNTFIRIPLPGTGQAKRWSSSAPPTSSSNSSSESRKYNDGSDGSNFYRDLDRLLEPGSIAGKERADDPGASGSSASGEATGTADAAHAHGLAKRPPKKKRQRYRNFMTWAKGQLTTDLTYDHTSIELPGFIARDECTKKKALEELEMFVCTGRSLQQGQPRAKRKDPKKGQANVQPDAERAAFMAGPASSSTKPHKPGLIGAKLSL